MGVMSCFRAEDLETVGEALDIAEDRTSGHYKYSFAQWKRHRYGVKTLAGLRHHEITRAPAFAVLNKYADPDPLFERAGRKRDFYSICLQDHRILTAMDRDDRLSLLPLLVYVFTHELVHIVRFCNFAQRFDIHGEVREREEEVVHATTMEVLKGLSLTRLDYILEVYRSHGFFARQAC
ncbi:MAG: hypothetical protein K9M82_12695 [Deltaproteobacteria bacterium]|nr:hypothetical protein [Deltaproteobacteria bacterium]